MAIDMLTDHFDESIRISLMSTLDVSHDSKHLIFQQLTSQH